jgi:phosphatidylglycerophosphate synthase
MLDARLRRYIDPPLDAAAKQLAGAGISADQLTITGAGLGVLAACAIAAGAFLVGLVLFLAGRLLDGLDGAVARQTKPTNRGAFLDIALDFVVYGAIPLGFALYDPPRNALAAAALLAGFLVNGSSFLAFALMAERLKLETRAQGLKSLYYLGGLAEGTETIIVFVAFCLWPSWFVPIASVFAAACVVSGVARVILACKLLTES